MSLFEVLITRAPEKPQPWFEPEMRAEPVQPKPVTHTDWRFASDQRKLAETWVDDQCFDLAGEQFEPFMEAWKKYWQARSEWDQDYKKQKLIQWPMAWALEVYNIVGGGGDTNHQALFAARLAATSGIRLEPFKAMVESESGEPWN